MCILLDLTHVLFVAPRSDAGSTHVVVDASAKQLHEACLAIMDNEFAVSERSIFEVFCCQLAGKEARHELLLEANLDD